MIFLVIHKYKFEYLSKMQLIKDFILATFVIILIFTIVESSSEIIEKKSDCKEATIHNGSQTGSFSINFEENCDIYTYRIQCFNEFSIIKIKSVFTDYNNLTNSKSGYQRVIQVLLKEFTTLTDGTKSLIAVNQWDIDLENDTSTEDKVYYSRTTDLTVTVEVTGNWSNCALNFFYEEVEFKEYRNSSDREGRISPWISMEGRGYRPNSVYLFQILKSEDMNASSIHLIVNKLQVDEGIGEYLLVGAGKEIFQGPPPLLISSPQSKKKIKINDENAYIVFVAASTRSHYSGFEITWKYNGTRITSDEDKIIDPGIVDESHSMPICIHNISAALNELNNSEDSFREFRERLASLGTEYAYNNNMNLKIDSSQVHIVRVSAIIGKKDVLYVMVKMQHAKNGKPIFTWNQLGYILKEYSSRFSTEVIRGYWIKHCAEETHQRKWANIIIYATAPVLCCICLLIWNWRNTPFSRIFSKKIKRAIIRSKKELMVPVEDNEYVSNYVINNTVPKVRITSDQGRRYTWNNDEGALSSGAEQDSDIEVFNRRDLQRSNSSRSNRKESGSARSSSRSLKRPEINMAFKNDECIDDIQNIPETSAPATECTYDTVNSQKSLLSMNSTFETKL